VSTQGPSRRGPSAEQIDALARGLDCRPAPAPEALLPGILAAADRRRRVERARRAALAVVLCGAGLYGALALRGAPSRMPRDLPRAQPEASLAAAPRTPGSAAGGEERETDLGSPVEPGAEGTSAARSEPAPAGALDAAPNAAVAGAGESLGAAGTAALDRGAELAHSPGADPAGRAAPSAALTIGSDPLAAGAEPRAWGALGQAWQRLAAASGAPGGSEAELLAWLENAPPLAPEIRRALRAVRSSESPARLDASIAAALADTRRPLDQRLGALLWIGQQQSRSAAALLLETSRRGDLLGALALRCLAADPAAGPELVRALADPERAALAAAALAEWPEPRAASALERAWQQALAAEPPWSEAALGALAARLLERGPGSLAALLAPLENSEVPLPGAAAAVAQALRGRPAAAQAALIDALARAIAERHSAAALALLASLPEPAALLALLELEQLGRGRSAALERSLRSAPVASAAVWAAAARLPLSRGEAELLLDRALLRGAPALALAPLLARVELPRDGRLWLVQAIADSGDAASAGELLEACLRLPIGEERLVAAALLAAARHLGSGPVEQRLSGLLPADLVSRLAETLRRERDSTRPARLAEWLRPRLPLALASAPPDG
jgi:hypothetical protein